MTYEQKKEDFTERFYKILENFEKLYKAHQPNIRWSDEEIKPRINKDLLETLPTEKKEEIHELIEELFSPSI